VAITISVRYHNMLRHHTGVAQEAVMLPEGTGLCAALEQLISRHDPGLKSMLLTSDGAISPHLVIFCNQRLVRCDQGDVMLADGDELLLFPAISGG